MNPIFDNYKNPFQPQIWDSNGLYGDSVEIDLDTNIKEDRQNNDTSI